MRHAYHLYTILVDKERTGIERDAFLDAMTARRIGVGVHYPALHLFAPFRALGSRPGQFPRAERIGRETVTLPLFPAMRIEDVDRVVDAVDHLLRSGAA